MIKKGLTALKYAFEMGINLWKSSKQIEKLQNKKLRKIVKNAYDNVPFYRELFDKHKIKPEDIKTVKDLKKLPVISKTDLRKVSKRKLISKKYKLSELKKYNTSGTTSEPFDIFFTEKEVINRLLLELRCFVLNGLKPTDKVLLLGPMYDQTWYEKLGLFRKKCLDSFSTADKQIKTAIEFKPTVLRGYPSCLALFTQEYNKRKLDFLHPKFIFSGAEILDDDTRQLIESTFKTKIFDIYGTWEFGRLAVECKNHSGLHLNDDYFVFEFADAGTWNKNEKEIIVTSLISYAMPFIRYCLADIVEVEEKKCGCGLSFKKLKSLNGRSLADYYILPDGTKISAENLNKLFKSNLSPLPKQYRLVQHTKAFLEIFYIRDKKLTKAEINRIKKDYENYVGNIKLKFTKTHKLSYEKNGKFKYFKSKLAEAKVRK